MVKGPGDPREIFPEFVADCKQAFGGELVGIILYGSAAGKDYRPGKSDINFLIVLSEKGIEGLDRAFSLVGKWRKRNVATPLFLTRVYVETSLDVYPIEYLNFQREYILVYGEDILADLAFDPEFIRLQAEREVKGKLLLLRRAFLETSGKGKALKQAISQSVQAFVAIFRALLYLKGLEIPKESSLTVRETCEAFDLEASVFEKLLEVRQEKSKLGDDEVKNLFRQYLGQVYKLSRLLDELGG
jgi:predicted nucleotidyltransferase